MFQQHFLDEVIFDAGDVSGQNCRALVDSTSQRVYPLCPILDDSLEHFDW